MADVAAIPRAACTVSLAHRVLALLAPDQAAAGAAPEARWLAALSDGLSAGRDAGPDPGAAHAGDVLARWRAAPPPGEVRLQALCAALRLGGVETMAAALALAVDTDPMVARAVAWLQAPAASAHPSIGLLSCLDRTGPGIGGDALVQLLDGMALGSGLLILEPASGSLQDATLRVPVPLVTALCGGHGAWPEVRLDAAPPPVLAADTLAALRGEARALLLAGGGLAIRSGHPGESWAGARALVAALGRRGAGVQVPPPPGLGPWLRVHDALPVVCAELQPGEHRTLPRVPGYDGPWLVATGPEGNWAAEDAWGSAQGLANWTLPLPAAGERTALWRAAGAAEADARLLGARHRHSAARIESLARTARGYSRGDGEGHREQGEAPRCRDGGPGGGSSGGRHDRGRASARHAQSGGAGPPAGPVAGPHGNSGGGPGPGAGAGGGTRTGDGFGLAAVARAARGAGRGELGALAELLREDVADDALVLPAPLRADLEVLTARCHARDTLADGLGPAARARYRPGVRSLLVGPSGTGKTLAAAWLATRLGLPLYRVDLASVSSKYIGETEKNLGELFARAEHAEVVLLFDEADALFGKRTDVKDANDRFANQQTNYLLQRIESFDGIVVLTSNARGRFDSAFTRRLDAVLEFPLPPPPQRRDLWRAHLGAGHDIDAADLNRLAGECELPGGHIRNVVLAARALALQGPIGWQHLAPAIQAEYRKIGKPAPPGITTAPGPA